MKCYCKKCLMPSTYLGIKLDAGGVCQYCNEYRSNHYLGSEKLLEDIRPVLARNTSQKYDCVVKFSGGRDSTYLLWYIVNKLHLRPLAVFSDDLFIPELALENLRSTCTALGVELRHITHDNLRKCLPHHLRAWMKRPVAESLMFLNVGERIGYEALPEEIAIEEGVYLLFGGRTPIQSAETYKTDLMKLGNRGGTFRWILGYVKQVLLNPSLAMNLSCLRMQYKEFNVKWWRQKLEEKYGLVTIHPYYEYVHWEEKEIERVLFDEVHWKMPDGAKNSSRWGCEVDTLRQYLFYRILGYNDTNVDLSYMIRDGLLTRDEAKIKLASSVNISEDYVRYIVDKAGVDADEFMAILHRYYPQAHCNISDFDA